MPVSAYTLRLLMDAGMTGDELLAVVESIDADHRGKGSSPASQKEAKEYVYLIAGDDLSQCKIGYSKNPWARAGDLSTGRADKLKVIATVKGSRSDERLVHSALDQLRIKGEWFELSAAIIDLFRAVATVDELLSQLPVASEANPQKGPFDKETPPVPPKEINISKKTPPIVPPGFEDFWELYRIKKGRKTAIKAFSQAIKSVDLQAMLDAVNRYQAVTDPKFQLHPTTWLNQERWTDDHSQLATGPPASQFQSHAAKMREEAAAKEAQANGQSH